MGEVRWLSEVSEARDPFAWLGGPFLGKPDYKLASGDVTGQLIEGDVSALPKVIGYTLLRSVLVGVGMAVAGMPIDRNWVKYSLAGGIGIEVFIILWALYKRGTEK